MLVASGPKSLEKKNSHSIYKSFVEIHLNNNSTIVDKATYDEIRSLGEYFSCIRSSRSRKKYAGNRFNKLHNLVLNPHSGLVVDHKNGNSLDNRSSNLRLVSMKENSQYQKHITAKNLMQGASYNKKLKRYEAYCTNNRTKVRVGIFDTLFEAVVARDAYITENKLNNALNFPPLEDAAPVVAFMGQQGSGKDTYATEFKDLLKRLDIPFYVTGIKDTFKEIALELIQRMEEMTGLKVSERQQKQVFLMVSTLGESIEPTVWSSRYRDAILDTRRIAVSSDIRTQMNLDVLRDISQKRKVVLFNMVASEETRRARISDTFRENGGYTEAGLTRHQISGENVFWYDIDTETDRNPFGTIVDHFFKAY